VKADNIFISLPSLALACNVAFIFHASLIIPGKSSYPRPRTDAPAPLPAPCPVDYISYIYNLLYISNHYLSN